MTVTSLYINTSGGYEEGGCLEGGWGGFRRVGIYIGVDNIISIGRHKRKWGEFEPVSECGGHTLSGVGNVKSGVCAVCKLTCGRGCLLGCRIIYN